MLLFLAQTESSDPSIWTQPTFELALDVGGAVVCLIVVARWIHRRRDPLRGAPIRLNKLEPVSVVQLVILYFLLAILIGMVVPGPASTDEPPTPEQQLHTASTQPIIALISGAACLFVGRASFRFGLRGMGLGRRAIWRDLVFAVVAYLAAIPVIRVLYFLSVTALQWYRPGFEPPAHNTIELLRVADASTAVKAWMVFGAAVVAPFCEEAFFRGIVQTVVKRLLGSRWGALACTGLIFGLIHMQQPQAILPLAFLGCVLGYTYERTGSLLCPILLHAIFNSVTLAYHFLGPAPKPI